MNLSPRGTAHVSNLLPSVDGAPSPRLDRRQARAIVLSALLVLGFVGQVATVGHATGPAQPAAPELDGANALVGNDSVATDGPVETAGPSTASDASTDRSTSNDSRRAPTTGVTTVTNVSSNDTPIETAVTTAVATAADDGDGAGVNGSLPENVTEGNASFRTIRAGLKAYYGTAYGVLEIRDATLLGAKNVDVDSQGDGTPSKGSTSSPGCGNDEIYIGDQSIDFNLETCGADDRFEIYYRATGPDPRMELEFRSTDGGIVAEGDSYTSDATIPLEGGVSEGDGGWSGANGTNESTASTDLRVEAHVVANDRPVPNATVRMEKFWERYPAGNATTVTGPQGRATFQATVGREDCHSVYLEVPNFDRRVNTGCHTGGTNVTETISVTEALAPIRVRVTDQWGYGRTGHVVFLKENGSTVESSVLDAQGRATFRVRPGDYTVGGYFPDGEQWKRVDHGDAASEATLQVDACAGPDEVVFGPRQPTTGDEVTFHACSGASQDGSWSFGDGNWAEGSVATHSYDQPGVYTVTYAPPHARGRTFQRTVVVTGSAATVESFAGVSDYRLEGTGVPEHVQVVLETQQDPEIETVEVIHDGHTFEAERLEATPLNPTPDGWSATVPGWALDASPGFEELTARVVYANGTHSADTSIRVWRPGPRLDNLIAASGVEHTGHHVDFRREVLQADFEASADDVIPENVPVSTGIGFGTGGEVVREGRFDQETGSVLIESDSGLDVQVLGWHASVISQTDFEDYEDGDVKRLRVRRFMLAGRGGPIGLPNKGVKIGPVAATIGGGFDPRFRYEFDDIPEATDDVSLPPPDDAWASMWVAITISASANVSIASINADGGVDVQRTWALANPYGSMGFGVQGRYVDPSGSFYISVGPFNSPRVSFDDFFGGEIGYGRNPDEPDWDAIGSEASTLSVSGDDNDSVPLRLRAVEGPAPPADAVSPSGSGAAVERVTDRGLVDETPSLARTDDGYLAAWTAQRSDAPASQGQAIAVARRENGTWSDRRYLTPPDGRSHHDPVVSTDGDEAVVTWTGLDANVSEVDTLSGLFEHLQVYYARYEHGNWSEPRRLTDAEGVVQSPSAAPTDDGWRLAWTASEPGAVGDSTVYTATVANGSSSNATALGPGRSPELVAANGSPVVTYYAADAGDVVRQRVDGAGGTETLARYDAAAPQRVVSSRGGAAWAGANGTDVVVATEGSTEVLETGSSVWQVDDVDLARTANATVLTYRANHAGNRSGVVGYRVRRNGSWSAPRVATRQWANGSLGAPSTAPADDGFLSLASASPAVENGTTDLFAVRQRFRPNYVLNATLADDAAAPGEPVSVDYRVANVGGARPSGNVALEATANESVQATRDLTAAVADGSATGTVEVETGPTGTVQLRVAADGPRHEPGRARDVVRVGTPTLRVADVAFTRPRSDAVRANVTVANVGDAAVQNLSLSAFDGEVPIANRTIESIAVDDTGSATIELDPATVNRSTSGLLVLDPEGRLPDAAFPSDAFAPRATVTPLVPADPSVSEHVRYRRLRNGSVLASAIVSNDGVGALNGTLQVYEEANGSQPEVANATVDLGPAVNETSRTRVVDVVLRNATRDQRLWFAVESVGPGSASGDAATLDRVPAVPSATGDVAVRVTDAASGAGVANATVEVGDTIVRTNATGHADLSPAVGDRELAVTADGYASASRTVAVRRRADSDLSIALSAPGRDGDDGGGIVPPSDGPDGYSEFVVRELTVPNETSPGESVRVGVTVENVGDVGGAESLRLSSPGRGVNVTRYVSLDPGETRAVEFTPRFESTGTVELVVRDESAELQVVAADSEPTDETEESGDGRSDDSTGDESADADDPSDGSEGDSGDSIPGFGFVAALVALVALAGRLVASTRR